MAWMHPGLRMMLGTLHRIQNRPNGLRRLSCPQRVGRCQYHGQHRRRRQRMVRRLEVAPVPPHIPQEVGLYQLCGSIRVSNHTNPRPPTILHPHRTWRSHIPMSMLRILVPTPQSGACIQPREGKQLVRKILPMTVLVRVPQRMRHRRKATGRSYKPTTAPLHSIHKKTPDTPRRTVIS